MGTGTFLYRLYDRDGQLIYVGITDDLEARFRRHAQEKFWWHLVARRETRLFETRLQARWAEWAIIEVCRPVYNRALTEPPTAVERPAEPIAAPAVESVVGGPQRADTDSVEGLNAALGQLEAARAAAWAVADGVPDDPAPEPAGDGYDLPPLPGEPNWAEVESWLPAIPVGKPHPRVRMRQLVLNFRAAGTGPGPVAQTLRDEGYRTAYQTVLGWMKDDAAAGILAQPGGDRQPYFPGPKIGDPFAEDAAP